MAESVSYQLEKCSDISKAEMLHEQLERYLTSGADIVIDASQVERIDTSVMQVLVSLSRTLEKQHLNASVVKPSDSFLSAVQLLGVAQELNIQIS